MPSLNQMDFGGIKIESPLFLAPIAGYTDSPFRRIARTHGAGLVVTELVSAEGLVRNNPKTMDLLRFDESERPLGIQLFGNDPAVMGDAAASAGRYRPDFIDINLGCPARRVCNTGSGAALLRDPERVFGIVRSVRAGTSLPVTAKIRLGWDSGSMNYAETVTAVREGGASAIFVHGRTREQKYGGMADWDAIAEISAMAGIPVAGNGDIRSFGEAHARMKDSGCAAVMIGRGALGNPWIFSGKEPSIGEIISQISAHCDFMEQFYGSYGVVLMRKHLTSYIHGMKNASHVRSRLVHAVSRSEVMSVLAELHE